MAATAPRESIGAMLSADGMEPEVSAALDALVAEGEQMIADDEYLLDEDEDDLPFFPEDYDNGGMTSGYFSLQAYYELRATHQMAARHDESHGSSQNTPER